MVTSQQSLLRLAAFLVLVIAVVPTTANITTAETKKAAMLSGDSTSIPLEIEENLLLRGSNSGTNTRNIEMSENLDYASAISNSKVEQILYLQREDEVEKSHSHSPGERSIRNPSERTHLSKVSLQTYNPRQSRHLSLWSSIFNFIRCPPGFHHDDNPHCHHHDSSHHSSNASPSSSTEGGSTEGGDGGSSSGGCGNDDGCMDGYASTPSPSPEIGGSASTLSPTVFEDNISNDHSCWWCNRGQRNNTASEGSYSEFTGTTTLAYGAVAMAGAAAVVSVILRKRYKSNTSSSSSDEHLLSGAVSKRKKNFSTMLENDDPTATTMPPQSYVISESKGGGKRKRLLQRLFHSLKPSKTRVGQVPEETLGTHYVQV